MKFHILASVLFYATLLYVVDGGGSTALRQSRNTDICNAYVDKIIKDYVNDKEYSSDPYTITEKCLVVHKKVILVNYTGEICIADGHIFGLSSLHREFDVIFDKKGKSLHLKIYIGAGEINVKGSGTVKMMKLGPKVYIDGTITYIAMKFDVIVNEKGEVQKVDDFDIEELKGVKLRVSGLGPLNFILNGLIAVLKTFFRRSILLAIEVGIKRYFVDKFKNRIFPVECLEEF